MLDSGPSWSWRGHPGPDSEVSFLSGYTPRKKQLTLMEFLGDGEGHRCWMLWVRSDEML